MNLLDAGDSLLEELSGRGEEPKSNDLQSSVRPHRSGRQALGHHRSPEGKALRTAGPGGTSGGGRGARTLLTASVQSGVWSE